MSNRCLCSSFALITAVVVGSGQAHAQAFPAPAAADARAIMVELNASQAGWNEASLAKHVGIYVDSVTFMTAAGPQPGRDRVVESFSKTYFKDGKPKQALNFDHVSLRALGPDHVLMTGNFHLTGGEMAENQGWFTLIWARTDDGWRVLHDHSS